MSVMMERVVMVKMALAAVACGLVVMGLGVREAEAQATTVPTVSVGWLDKEPPAAAVGVSFGVAYPRGMVQKGQQFAMRADGNVSLPVQSWPLAYWPDGSMKWVGFATVAGPEVKGPVQISASSGEADQKGLTVKVTDGADALTVDTGKVVARIPKSGRDLIESLAIGGKNVATHGRLECIDQTGPTGDPGSATPEQVAYESDIQKVTVEQTGPVRAVVKIEGVHTQSGPLAGEARKWLPFVVRLYFYAGQEPVRVVHTIVFDGDQDKDFIKGLGITFDVPMREQSQNRHVRFANSNGGVWAEPLQQVLGRGRGAGIGGTGANQIEGERLPNFPEGVAAENAEWDSFRLLQLSSEGFTLDKRTNPKSSWVNVNEGQRAAGYGFIGDVSGGLGVGVKNFWQSYPASMEITGALSDAAHFTAWLWSPSAPAMDLRHYDTHGHGNVNTGGSYEDYEADFATPTGIGKTSELMLFPMDHTPTRAETAVEAGINEKRPLLTMTPEYLHSTGVFGVWSLQDRSTPLKKAVEDRLDAAIDYYQKSIDQQHWYGFWNYGDVRHTYDPQRHEWRYDVGGYAWDNSELGSVLWVWYSYIRTGRADIFRMAENMIRETSEVDTYHMGRFDGLGSRHNVSHWGDSAKEARISQAAHAQFYYFLTTDERVGDIMMHEAEIADKTASVLDPMRKAQPITPEWKGKYPGRVRVGPDWLAFVGNWMIAWERTGDVKWRDKIMAGVDSMYEMPFWMRTGRNLVMGYDWQTGKLYQEGDTPGTYNLPTIQGGAEVAFELTPLLDDPKWTKMWLQYCRLGNANAATLTKDKETGTEGADASLIGEQGGSNSQGTPRLAGFVYYKTQNKAFGERALRALAARPGEYETTHLVPPEVLNPMDEAPGVSTNETAQSSLQAIEVLEMCKDILPTDPLPAPTFGGRGGFRGGRGGRGGRGAAPGAGGGGPPAGGGRGQ
ncbi:MAG TPA: Tat pathway signal sequence domain protein [Phycisphaerae bacterium]|nr:Tat pathway signal sequence domain protein [Phycisphaerae bacterium]